METSLLSSDLKESQTCTVFPFSIGKLLYKQILEEFNSEYSSIIVKNLLEDSFVVKGGKFWKKIF